MGVQDKPSQRQLRYLRQLANQTGTSFSPPRGGAVREHQRPPGADALIGDFKPVRADDLHRRNLHPGSGPENVGQSVRRLGAAS